MIAIWVFLKALSPRTWIIAGLVALVGYTGIRLYHLGIEHEAVKAKNATLETDKTEAQKERDAFEVQMKIAQATEASAVATIQAQNVRLAVLDSRLSADRAHATAALATVAALPDTALFGDITQRVGKRAQGDAASTFYPAELREIDVRLAELPPLQDQLTDLSSKVDTLQLRSSAQDENIAALKTERGALFLYASQLHDHYAKAYALAQPHVSLFVRIVSFGMKRPKKLTLPAPEAIPVPAQ
jgi:chromosome segregation ATPase